MRNGLIKKVALPAMLLTTIGVGSGCADRPYALKGGQNYSLSNDLKLGKITEEDSRYKAKGLSVFKKDYYVANTALGTAMFKDDKSIESITYCEHKNGKIHGHTSIQSGEGGLYFLEKVEDSSGDYMDWVSIVSNFKKADVREPKLIKKQGDLGIFKTTEQDKKFNFDYAKIEGKTHLFVHVKKSEENIPGLYDFFSVPIHKLTKRTNANGEMILWNDNQVYRPKFKPWEEIDQKISNLPREFRTHTKDYFKALGMPVADEIGTRDVLDDKERELIELNLKE